MTKFYIYTISIYWIKRVGVIGWLGQFSENDIFSPNLVRLPSFNKIEGGKLSSMGYFDPLSQKMTLNDTWIILIEFITKMPPLYPRTSFSNNKPRNLKKSIWKIMQSTLD